MQTFFFVMYPQLILKTTPLAGMALEDPKQVSHQQNIGKRLLAN